MTGLLKKRLLLPFTLMLLALFLLGADRVVAGAREGLLLCARTLIPALLPFTVLSKLLVTAELSLPGGRLFERCFRLPRAGVTALLIGCLCGFPLGAKTAADLCRHGQLSEEQTARLICFSNNTGPAFVVAGVGASLLRNPALGWLLYLSQIAAALILGILEGIGKPPVRGETGVRVHTSASLSSVFYEASLALLGVCGTVVFFSALCSLPAAVLPPPLFAFFCSFLEVGNAAKAATVLAPLPRLLLSSFAVSFAGLSVHLQTLSVLQGVRLPFPSYLLAKLMQGLLSVGITLLLLPFFL